MAAHPSLTIGLVVRNGAQHLRQAIQAIQQQTFADYHIIACDNASTDDTPQILQETLHQGFPLRNIRHPHDIGWLRNFIGAAEQVETEYFCWATHDDLRDPRQLQTLIDLLKLHPTAGLACCAVRDMNPDDSLCDVRSETLSLRTTVGMSSAQRVLMHLRDAAGTPFYGVFRTSALHRSLPLLRQIAEMPGSTMIGVDMAFIAAIMRDHDVAVTHEPLLLFRRGGWSHRIDLYGSLGNYLRQIVRFNRLLKQATRSDAQSTIERIQVSMARQKFLIRYLLSPPMRRMTWHYVSRSLPLTSVLDGWMKVRLNATFRRLRQRFRTLPRGSRIALFGAGKHTRRCWPVIRAAAGSHVTVVGAIDDAAGRCAPIADVPIVTPANLKSFGADVVLISSDTYEEALLHRAQLALPTETRIWCLYDQALEAVPMERSAFSTSVMNAFSSSNASLERIDRAASGRAA